MFKILLFLYLIPNCYIFQEKLVNRIACSVLFLIAINRFNAESLSFFGVWEALFTCCCCAHAPSHCMCCSNPGAEATSLSLSRSLLFLLHVSSACSRSGQLSSGMQKFSVPVGILLCADSAVENVTSQRRRAILKRNVNIEAKCGARAGSLHFISSSFRCT